jgi:NAD(P)H-flavin reductase
MSRLDLPRAAIVRDRLQESPSIVTLRCELEDMDGDAPFVFQPGQFNMVYLYGVGEVPLSIVSDPQDTHFFDHTVRALGRTTDGLTRVQPGDRLGIRGPLGRGWPVAGAQGRDVLVVSGGLGCAPVSSVIRYVLRRRERYGRLFILQGVRHVEDLIWRTQYEAWATEPETQVMLAADVVTTGWTGAQGPVVDLLARVDLDPRRTVAMLCGPELMVIAAIADLRGRGVHDRAIWLSLKRNMHCGVGSCGHCQIGPKYVCTDGPIFTYAEIADQLGLRGF